LQPKQFPQPIAAPGSADPAADRSKCRNDGRHPSCAFLGPAAPQHGADHISNGSPNALQDNRNYRYGLDTRPQPDDTVSASGGAGDRPMRAGPTVALTPNLPSRPRPMIRSECSWRSPPAWDWRWVRQLGLLDGRLQTWTALGGNVRFQILVAAQRI